MDPTILSWNKLEFRLTPQWTASKVLQTTHLAMSVWYAAVEPMDTWLNIDKNDNSSLLWKFDSHAVERDSERKSSEMSPK